MTIHSEKDDFLIKGTIWENYNLYKLYQEAYTPWEWHAEIFERAKQHGMIAFSTPFDVSAVDFLETLNVPLYKIASFENTDLNLIRRVAATGKPVIISTGMASVAELSDAVGAARDGGAVRPAHPRARHADLPRDAGRHAGRDVLRDAGQAGRAVRGAPRAGPRRRLRPSGCPKGQG